MLAENIKAFRKSKGLSQQELADSINVVRQTVSKWEQGRSVPDSEMLIAISKTLEAPVSTLLGETVIQPEADDINEISKRLEEINLLLAKRQAAKTKMLHWLFISVFIITAAVCAILLALKSPYLNWNYENPETAVLGTAFKAFEWLFTRIAPIALIISIIGAVMTRRKK